MYRNLFLIITLLIFTVSCRKENYYEKIVSEHIAPIDSVRAIVVIPGIGCLGCISGVERYLRLNFNKLSNVKFILTNIQSIKTLRLKIGDAINSPNICLDKNNIWYDTSNENSIYPIVMRIKGKKILELEYISPDNPRNLQAILKGWGISLPS